MLVAVICHILPSGMAYVALRLLYSKDAIGTCHALSCTHYHHSGSNLKTRRLRYMRLCAVDVCLDKHQRRLAVYQLKTVQYQYFQ